MLGYLPARLAIDETISASNTTANTGAIWLGPDGITRISLHAEWNQDTTTSQNLATTSVYEASNDPRARISHPDHANANWDDITADITSATDIDASTGSGDGSHVIDNFNYEFLRITVTRSGSVDGDYKLYVSGRSG